jgi:hypothetical protein
VRGNAPGAAGFELADPASVQHAHDDGARDAEPAGCGTDRGRSDAQVCELQVVPRRDFVPEHLHLP